MKLSKLSVFLFVVLFQSCIAQSTKYTFIIFSDIKGQLEEYSKGSEADKPVPCSGQQDTCRGGLRKIVEQIDGLRNASQDKQATFVLTPGNLVGGESGWLSFLRWWKYGELLKYHYKPDAVTLGMNDFGAGLERTVDYVNEFINTSAVVLSNLNCGSATGAMEKEFCNLKNLNTETVHPLASTVGLVGFINPDVTKLSSPGKLEFTEVIPALQSTIQRSTSYATYIAMGDGTLDLAKQILAQIPQIKLVIYGRSFGGSTPMSEFPLRSGNGYIARAGNYGSTVGKLELEVGPSGDIVNTSGSQLIYTDPVASIHSNATTMYTRFQQDIVSHTKTIASSHYKLVGGEDCWRKECNLGNLITDAMVHCVLSHAHDGNVSIPSKKPIFALWHSGALFKDTVNPDENITTLDIHRWLPFHNRVYFTKIKGSNLFEVFQRSASGLTAHLDGNVKDWGQFLQVSNGMEVYYSTSGEKPQVSQIRLLHDEANTPVMQPLNPNDDYYFVIPSFIFEGRNLYDFAKGYWDLAVNIDFDDSCVERYVTAMKRVATGFEERIWVDAGVCDSKTFTTGTNTAVTVVVTIVITLVIVGVVYAIYFHAIPRITGKRPDGFNNL